MSLQTDLAAAVASAQADATKLRGIVQGPAAGPDSLVATTNGNVKTLNRITAEAAAAAAAGVVPFTPPVPWAPGLNCVVGPPATAITHGGESYYCNVPHVAGATFEADAAKWTKFAAKGIDGTNGANGADGLSVIKGYLLGLTLSTPGASANLTVAAGLCGDETGVELMTLAAGLTKGTGAWAVGDNQGGLDQGAIANNTWYHRYLIKRPDTGVVDTCFSLSAAGPTVGGANPIPAAYTRYRRIGAAKTDGAGLWKPFLQRGDRFYIVPVTDFSAGGGYVLALTTISVPTGVRVVPLNSIFASSVNNTGSSMELAPGDNSALLSTYGYNANGNAGGIYATNPFEGPPTNLSAQIYVQVSQYSNGINLSTRGWIDRRGQDG